MIVVFSLIHRITDNNRRLRIDSSHLLKCGRNRPHRQIKLWFKSNLKQRSSILNLEQLRFLSAGVLEMKQ